MKSETAFIPRLNFYILWSSYLSDSDGKSNHTDMMDDYSASAKALVAEMQAKAALSPTKAVAFQGAPGCNSNIAIQDLFPDSLPLPCFSFADALTAVKEGRAGRAMIPIENSLNGRVADMHFLLPESGLTIQAEYFLPINHCLVAPKGAGEITHVLSHPQALGQCRHWLQAHNLRALAHADTAGAAAEVADRKQAGLAALSPALAAKLYGLEILEKGIADGDTNITRFVVLAEADTALQDLPPIRQNLSGKMMTSLLFTVKNTPSALLNAIKGFGDNQVNMTKLESYQHGASFSATQFYADVEGEPSEDNVARALDILQENACDLRILGVYAQARPRQ
ncbi:MAG: prephenate dehydratase [Zymomonas mobilis]|uniref:prephenate dehydratase n=1 Tax=Zymomonas mobilis TaxID=542 RepID=UPI0001B70766|nr:prephenate dehydratase [Zymomonas mobilis]ACV76079.1 Prephenate dehydratase [Zymomonas mobilis subsp. mobilis NCIMB 11163]